MFTQDRKRKIDNEDQATEVRTGTWTFDEVKYLEALAKAFHEGSLDIPEGSTLRAYLAQQLGCNTKRISKRMEGNDYNGRRKFRKVAFSEEELKQKRDELQALRLKFEESIENLKIREAKLQERKQRKANLAAKNAKKNAAPPATTPVSSPTRQKKEENTRSIPVIRLQEAVQSPLGLSVVLSARASAQLQTLKDPLFRAPVATTLVGLAPTPPSIDVALLNELRASQLLNDAMTSRILLASLASQPLPPPRATTTQTADQAVLARLLMSSPPLGVPPPPQKRARFF